MLKMPCMNQFLFIFSMKCIMRRCISSEVNSWMDFVEILNCGLLDKFYFSPYQCRCTSILDEAQIKLSYKNKLPCKTLHNLLNMYSDYWTFFQWDVHLVEYKFKLIYDYTVYHVYYVILWRFVKMVYSWYKYYIGHCPLSYTQWCCSKELVHNFPTSPCSRNNIFKIHNISEAGSASVIRCKWEKHPTT
jgi:hypothetical protein